MICIKLGNEIENTFTIQYITSVVSASGNFYNFSFFKDTVYLPFFLSLIRTTCPLCSYTFSISPLPAENEDFISNTDSLVISPGETESCVEIIITDDKSPESSETFSIDFTFDLPPDTTPIPPVSSMVTIVDNDVCELYFNTDRYHSVWCTNHTPFFSLCPVIGFRASTYSVVEGTNSFVTLILFREGGIDLPTAVNITTIDGTASTGKYNNCCFFQCNKKDRNYLFQI